MKFLLTLILLIYVVLFIIKSTLSLATIIFASINVLLSTYFIIKKLEQTWTVPMRV